MNGRDFGHVLVKAGFSPNPLTPRYERESIFRKMIGLMRRLGKFPAHGDLRIERNRDPKFPGSGALFHTKEQKNSLAKEIVRWCSEKSEYDDIVRFCQSAAFKGSNL